MKKFVRNGLLFCIIGIVILYPSTYMFSFSELKILKRALKSDKDVIMFGSSVNDSYAPTDTDMRTIAEMLDSFMGEQSVIGISHGAYQADIYLEYVRYIINSGKKPIIIIPINLRYFSPEWDLRPGYQFEKERYILNGLPYFGNYKYREITESEFENTTVYNGSESVGKVKDFLDVSRKESDKLSEARKGFVFHYMQPLKANHRKLKSLSKICEIGIKNNLKIVMYITPIDYKYAEQLQIEGFRHQQCDNVSTIKSVLASCEIQLIDLSMALDSSYFFYNIRPNEHLNMRGRREVVKALKSAVRHIKSP